MASGRGRDSVGFFHRFVSIGWAAAPLLLLFSGDPAKLLGPWIPAERTVGGYCAATLFVLFAVNTWLLRMRWSLALIGGALGASIWFIAFWLAVMAKAAK